MSYNYTLKYRTFDELLADASNDFKKYQLEDLIDAADLIKVARRVTYDLGLRVYKTKERVLEVHKGRVRLPNDFYVLNFAMACGSHQVRQYLRQGRHIEERIVGTLPTSGSRASATTQNLAAQTTKVPGTGGATRVPASGAIDFCKTVPEPIQPIDPCCDPCLQCGSAAVNCEPCNTCCANPNSCTLNCNGDVVQLIQVMNSETRVYSFLSPIRMKENAESIDCDCPNLYWDSDITAYIKDGWLYTSFESGNVYINYQGHLEDDEGNLLVPDHDVINEYYEYALKQRMVENLIMNDEEVNPNKLQLIEQRYRAARNYALTIVNTPNYSELRRLYKANRNAQLSKYYDMFSSHRRIHNRRY